jgi:hemolysin (HlyC) family protein
MFRLLCEGWNGIFCSKACGASPRRKAEDYHRERGFVSLEESQPEKQRKLFGWFRKKIGMKRASEELQEVIEQIEERGIINHDESDMIEGIFDLKQTVAREIMIPRTHISAVSADCSLEQLLKTIIESGHSRIPVYKENIDQIVGILNAKDLLPVWLSRSEEFNLDELTRDAYFVPETKRINDLLNELRNKKSHLAVVVDEYGGTSGIVTIEDIIEEIIGEIRDEHDVEEEFFLPQEDGSVLVNAWVNVDDFAERFCVDVPRGGYDTVGGFVIHLLGRVPTKGEQIGYEGLALKVVAGDEKRITRFRVTPEAGDHSVEAPSPPELTP